MKRQTQKPFSMKHFGQMTLVLTHKHKYENWKVAFGKEKGDKILAEHPTDLKFCADLVGIKVLDEDTPVILGSLTSSGTQLQLPVTEAHWRL